MGLVDAYGLVFPALNGMNTSSNFLLDASGEQAASLFLAPKTGTIRKICWRTGTVTTATDTTVGLQNITASGNPDDSFDQSVSVPAGSISSNAWITSDLGAGSGRSVVAQDLVAAVIAPSGSPNYNVAVTGGVSQWSESCVGTAGTPYGAHKTGGSWSKQASWPSMFLEYDDGSYFYCPGLGVGVRNEATSLSSSTDPDEVGNRLYFPFEFEAWGATCERRTNNSNTDFILYAADGSVLRTISRDPDVAGGNANGRGWTYPFSSPILIERNTEYFLIIKPTDTTSAIATFSDFPSAASLDQLSGGSDIHGVSRVNAAGSWTNHTARRYWVSLISSRIHDGTGSGGAVGSPFRNRVFG